ncbi:uncharacterized protein LOC121935744 isoform X2 [Sceloporus undulatus]|nr:uncharacterized protein LOC121935744 isoform X2 [Sceloporus undulatus]XP_042333510.1 uncharacterized protein LOC121935744 isoform X2 [Sceloporus undulatus]
MALEEGDPGTLKRHIVHLLLKYPQGISFGEFSGAFYQFHGYYPHISVHGYHSLRELVADMKNVMVVEGDSLTPVMKIANGFHLHHWLQGDEENDFDSSDRRTESLIDKDEDKALAEVLDLLVSLLREYSCGLRIKRVQKFMLSKHGVNMEKFSIAHGYRDILEFLEHQMPELEIRYQENASKCVVQLCKGTSSPTPSLDTGFTAGNTDTLSEKLITKTSDLAAALVPIIDVLGDHPLGMNLETLKENLQRRHGFNLDTFCQRKGYEDAMSCLLHVPGLCLSFTNNKCPGSCVVQLLSGSLGLQNLSLGTSSSLDKPLTSSCSNILSQESTKTKPEAWTEVLSLVNKLLTRHKTGIRIKKIQEYLMATHGVDLEKFSIAHGYKDSLEFLELRMPNLTITYRKERVKCVVKFGPDHSAARVSSLLGTPMPSSQPTKMLEPVNSASDFGNVSKPSVTPHHFSTSKSQSNSLSFPASSMSTTVKNGTHSSIRISLPVVPKLPSFQEDHTTSSVKASNPSHSFSNGLSQNPSANQFDGPSPAKEVPCHLDRQLPSKSNVTNSEPSKDHNGLKQQVAHILAMHPEGMSLFQFRVAYSTTYQQYLPLGNATSAKHLLLQMPDVVNVKNYGVQTQLLPVSCEMPSVKSDQPLFSTEKKVPVVPGCSPPRKVSVAQLNSEELAGKESKECCLFPEPQLHKAPKPGVPVQEYVKMSPKSMEVSFTPACPVISPTYSQVTARCKNLKPNNPSSQPMHLTNPWISGNNASVPSTSQPASISFGIGAQPFLCQLPGIPCVYPVSFHPVPRNPFGIQLKNTALQISSAQQVRCAQTMPRIHSTAQQSYSHAFRQVGPYSAVQKSYEVPQHAQCPARTITSGRHPVSSPSRNMSQTVHQTECYNHTQQYRSVVVEEKSFTITTLDRKSEPPASAYLKQYSDGNFPITSASPVSFSSHARGSTSASFQSLDSSSSSKSSSNVLPSEPPAFMNQQQSTSVRATITTSGRRPCSPPSVLDSAASPNGNLHHSGTNSNSATQSVNPLVSIHQQQCTGLSTSVITSSRKTADASPYSQNSTIKPSYQLSSTPLSVHSDYEAPAQANPMVSVSKDAGRPHVFLPEKQSSYYYPPQNSPPPPKSSDKCVIL